MDYTRIYDNLINRAISRDRPSGYIERHHIIPKCLGGSDDVSNLVELTPEEHYLAHQLLVKIHPLHKGLAFAAIAMASNGKHLKRSKNKIYGWLKKKHSDAGGTTTGRRCFHIPGKSGFLMLSPDDVIPEGYIPGRGMSPTTGTKGKPKGSDAFSRKEVQQELNERKWNKFYTVLANECGLETKSDIVNLIIEYKSKSKRWFKELKRDYPKISRNTAFSLAH